MSELYIIKEETLTSIADNIREKTGKTDSISPDDMASGVNEVYESGKTAQNNEWWDAYLAQMRAGRPNNYLFAGSGWNGNTFYPNQDIIVTENAQGLFNRFSWNSNVPIIDLAQRLEECGVILDFSQAAGISSIFEHCWVTRLPLLNFNSTKFVALSSIFANAKYLQTIDEFIIRNDGSNTFSKSFDGCTALKNITITGVIGRNISFSNCPLTVKSMKSIIFCLKNYAGITDDSGNSLEHSQTLTLKASCVTELEASEFTDEDKEWLSENGMEYTDELTWTTVIDNLKWNLVSA